MRILTVLLVFILGAAAGYAASIAAYVVYIELTGTVDREGGLAMGVAFIIGPVVALLAGTTAALLVLWRSRRR